MLPEDWGHPMSAVDPVDPPTIMNFGPATVIDISKRTTTASQGRWKPLSTPHPQGGTDDRQQLADHIEMTFNEQKLTLSDDDTADAFRITLQVVRGLLAGAGAQGIVDERQAERLDALVEGVIGAPDLV